MPASACKKALVERAVGVRAMGRVPDRRGPGDTPDVCSAHDGRRPTSMWNSPMKSALPDLFFKDTATTEIYTLSLHDALPIWGQLQVVLQFVAGLGRLLPPQQSFGEHRRSGEHTSELQSPMHLVWRLLLG